MLLNITHKTEYAFGAPVHYALQKVRLVPRDTPQQRVIEWHVTVESGQREVAYFDQFGNVTELVSTEQGATCLTIEVSGRLETKDTAGVLGKTRSASPLWLFLRQTGLTEPGDGVKELGAQLQEAPDKLDGLHRLSQAIRDQVAYGMGKTYADTSAEEALQGGQGVCQDHAHIFVSAARVAGVPARYVSGYLMMTDRVDQDATHAWAEAYLDGLGWVGFDVSNGYSPDERYARIATGSDYGDAAPISGLRQGGGGESLNVSLQVQQ